MSSTTRGLLVGGIVLSAVCAVVHRYVTHAVPEPYMDEIFHIPQAQRYCDGDFFSWDPKLTTPPGLYVLSVLLLKIKSILLPSADTTACSTAALRFMNILFGLGNFIVLRQILNTVHGSSRSHTRQAFVISFFPTLFFFNFLYYTDSGSTFFVFLSYLLGLRRQYIFSAAAGLIATTFRQTNIVWVAFTAVLVIARALEDKSNPVTKGALKSERIRVGAALGQTIIDFIVLCIRHLPYILSFAWPYIAVALAFGGFLLWNGGIVLGDKSNHEATLNFPQLFYFVAFLQLFTLPATSILNACREAPGNLRYMAGSVLRISFLLVLPLLSYQMISAYTKAHPFMLADNRHYPFYIWRRIYQRHPLVKYALIPAYLGAAYICIRKLAKSQSLLWILGYFASLLITLVPSPLLEFRYFIIPFLFFRLHIAQPSGRALALEFAQFAIVNAVTTWVFVNLPFRWESEQGVRQRFMW